MDADENRAHRDDSGWPVQDCGKTVESYQVSADEDVVILAGHEHSPLGTATGRHGQSLSWRPRFFRMWTFTTWFRTQGPVRPRSAATVYRTVSTPSIGSSQWHAGAGMPLASSVGNRVLEATVVATDRFQF